jgi:hypothetical protein
MKTPIERAVITRRINKRAADWKRLYRPSPAETKESLEKGMRKSGRAKADFIANVLDSNTLGIHRALRNRKRDGEHMRRYWRIQVLGWLRNLRACRIAESL